MFAWPFFTRHRVNSPTLKAIYIATKAGAPVQSVASGRVLVDAGIQGDRYSEARGFWKATDACQVTLISEDDLMQAKRRTNAALQEELDKGNHRRNLVVGGIKTKLLKGKTFRIGQAVFRYQKPRPPCAYLEKIQGRGMSRALGKHSGMCLSVIHGGTILVGDKIEIINTDSGKN